MLKKNITYKTFNGNEVTAPFYFNMTKAELIELEVSEDEGFNDMIQRVVRAESRREIIAVFKKMILMSYGVKAPNGDFLKSEEIRQAFATTEAYSELFMELSQNDNAASAFVNGIVPEDLRREVEAAVADPTPAEITTTAAPVLEKTPVQDDVPAETTPTRDELLAMTDEEFDKAVGKDPTKMSPLQLTVAYQRKVSS